MNNAPIFVGGFQRSGTTLLRYILEAHPNIACGPETVNLIPETRACVETLLGNKMFRESLDAFRLTEEDIYRIYANETLTKFFEKYLETQSKQRLATKTPTNCLHFEFLGRAFPKAYFIHVIRDGRDCVVSLDKVHWFGNTLSDPGSFDLAVKRWARWTYAGRSQGRALGHRYIEVRYENLVSQPEEEIGRILEFVGEPWDDMVMKHHEVEHAHEVSVDDRNRGGASKKIDARRSNPWKSEMTPKQVYRFCRIAGSLLEELDYELSPDWPRGDSYLRPDLKKNIVRRGWSRLSQTLGGGF